jgi:hypothetical protein
MYPEGILVYRAMYAMILAVSVIYAKLIVAATQEWQDSP